MKRSSALVASLSGILLVVGCQKTSPPASTKPVPTGQPQANTPALNSQERLQGSNTSAESETASDQPDDPGMTTAHDKTAQQEEPSGDESSRAAPNDGDAEPPQ